MASLTPDAKDVLEANERFYESLSAGSIRRYLGRLRDLDFVERAL